MAFNYDSIELITDIKTISERLSITGHFSDGSKGQILAKQEKKNTRSLNSNCWTSKTLAAAPSSKPYHRSNMSYIHFLRSINNLEILSLLWYHRNPLHRLPRRHVIHWHVQGERQDLQNIFLECYLQTDTSYEKSTAFKPRTSTNLFNKKIIQIWNNSKSLGQTASFASWMIIGPIDTDY